MRKDVFCLVNTEVSIQSCDPLFEPKTVLSVMILGEFFVFVFVSPDRDSLRNGPV